MYIYIYIYIYIIITGPRRAAPAARPSGRPPAGAGGPSGVHKGGKEKRIPKLCSIKEIITLKCMNSP